MRAQQTTRLLELAPASDQRRRLAGQVRRVDATWRRKLRRAELVELHRLAQVLEPVSSEEADRNSVVEQLARRLREQNLTAVAGSSDPCGEVNVDPAIAPLH